MKVSFSLILNYKTKSLRKKLKLKRTILVACSKLLNIYFHMNLYLMEQTL